MMDDLPPPIGDLVIWEGNPIHNGNFSTVCYAKYKDMKCVSKMSQLAKRIENECSILRKLSRHNNIVRYICTGIHPKLNCPILVMEQMDCNLKEFIEGKEEKPITWKEQLTICYGVSCGLAYLHSRSYIHQNICDSNVLVKNCPSKLMVKICGFGVARKLDDIYTVSTNEFSYKVYNYYTKADDVKSFGAVAAQTIRANKFETRNLMEEIIASCRKDYPEERPSAEVVCTLIEAVEQITQRKVETIKDSPYDTIILHFSIMSYEKLITVGTALGLHDSRLLKMNPSLLLVEMVAAVLKRNISYSRFVEAMKNLRIIGDLVIGEEIAKGGYGIVSYALYKSLPCATKELKEPRDHSTLKDRVESIKKDCFILKEVQNENIVKYIHTITEPDCNPILVMELMDCSLNKYIEDCKFIKRNDQLNICEDVCCGLDYLHSKDLIHRDLCDANVLLETYPMLKAKIADFGLSKLLEFGRSSISMSFCPNRPGYLGPECYDSKKQSYSLDIYSFGVVAIQTVQSSKYFETKEQMLASFQKIRNDHPLREMIERCIKDNPKERLHSKACLHMIENARFDDYSETYLPQIGELAMRSDRIGDKGFFGSVHEAKYKNEECAAKILADNVKETFKMYPQEFIKKECSLLEKLEDTNIVHYIATVYEESEAIAPIFVMELMDCNLRTFIKEYKPLTLKEQLTICHGASCGLKYLHSKGYFHRNLCDNNVLLKYHRELTAKIADFGMSKLLKHTPTDHSLAVHAHRSGYLPPEVRVYKSENVAHCCSCLDVYSFGAIAIQTVRSVVQFESNLPKDLPGKHPLKKIIASCIEEDPEKRPSAEEVCKIIGKEMQRAQHEREKNETCFILPELPYPPPLTLANHYSVIKYLGDLGNEELIDLGTNLGLSLDRLEQMHKENPSLLLENMVASWLSREDKVITTRGHPSWDNLMNALQDLRNFYGNSDRSLVKADIWPAVMRPPFQYARIVGRGI